MSVVLDALRRARQGRGPAPASSAPVPAGLRPPPRRGSSRRSALWVVVPLLVVAAAALWAVLNFAPHLLRRESGVRAITQPIPRGDGAAARAATPSIGEMIKTIQEPPAVAPRAMPDARPSTSGEPTGVKVVDLDAPPGARGAAAAPAAPRRPASTPAPAPRLPAPRPLPSAPAPALSSAAVTAAAPAPIVNHFELAVRYHALGNFEQALKHYLAVLEAQEFNVEARNNLGLLYHGRGLVPEAVDQFRRALLIQPNYLKARSNLAVVLMQAGRLAEARAELRAALALEPRNVDLLVNMALVEKADHHPAGAQELLLRALGQQPTHAVAHYNLGLLYEEGGNRAKAADHYTEFLKYAGPEHGELLSEVRRKIDSLVPRALPR